MNEIIFIILCSQHVRNMDILRKQFMHRNNWIKTINESDIMWMLFWCAYSERAECHTHTQVIMLWYWMANFTDCSSSNACEYISVESYANDIPEIQWIECWLAMRHRCTDMHLPIVLLYETLAATMHFPNFVHNRCAWLPSLPKLTEWNLFDKSICGSRWSIGKIQPRWFLL